MHMIQVSKNRLNFSFYVFHIDFGDNFFLFSMLAKCDRGESCTGKLAPISPKGPKLVAKTEFVYIDEGFAINGFQPKFLSLLLTSKFRRGVTERVRLKRIFISGEYTFIQRLYIALSYCMQTHKVQNPI